MNAITIFGFTFLVWIAAKGKLDDYYSLAFASDKNSNSVVDKDFDLSLPTLKDIEDISNKENGGKVVFDWRNP